MRPGAVILLAAYAAGSRGGAAETVTWEACAAEARDRHPALRAARFRLETARERRWSALGGFLPTIGTSASADAYGDRSVRARVEPRFGTRLTFGYPVFTGFATSAAVAQASAAATAAEARYRATGADVRRMLRAAFTEARYRQEALALREALAARWQLDVELVRTRVSATREEQSSLEQAAAESAKAGFEVSRARRAVTLARQRLSRAMGRERFAPIEVAGAWDAAPPPTEPNLDALVETSPAVAEAAAALAQEAAAAREAASPFWPSVDASVGFSRDSPAWPPGESRTWFAGVSLNYSLFNGWRHRAGLVAARNAADAAREEMVIARRDARESLEEAFAPYADAFEAVAVRRQSRDAARARADDGRAHYAAGELGFDQFRELVQGCAETDVEFLGAQREALDAEAGWRRALGETFPP